MEGLKYIIFAGALLGMVPLALAAVASRRVLQVAMFLMPLAMFDQGNASINFFSAELYRGTARGMEVSLIYLFAFSILLAIILRGKLRGGPFPDFGGWLFFLFFLTSLLSLCTAANRMYAFFEIWKMFNMWLVYRATWAYLDATHDVETPIFTFAVGALMNMVKVVHEHVVGCAQAHGLFPHQNSLAMWCMVTGMILYASYLNRRRTPVTLFHAAGFLASMAALLRSYSRGALAVLPFGALVVTWFSIRRNCNFRMLMRLAPLVGVAFFGFILIAPRIIDRFNDAPQSSADTRKNFAITALNMVRDEPIYGVGLNNWGIKVNPPYNYATYREELHIPETFKEGIVETVYLLVLAECGIPCFLVFLWWYAWEWLAVVKLSKKLARTKYFWLVAGIAGGLVGVYLQSLLEWVLKQRPNFTQLMIVYAYVGWFSRRWRVLREEEEAERMLEERPLA